MSTTPMSEWTITSPPEQSTPANRAAALFHLRALRELGWVAVDKENEA